MLPPENRGKADNGPLSRGSTHPRVIENVASARRIVVRQRHLIEMTREGDCEQAAELLSMFERSLEMFEADLANIISND